jgi:hypothetical protein
MATREVKVYEIINNKAGSNMFVQGLSGALGFGVCCRGGEWWLSGRLLGRPNC